MGGKSFVCGGPRIVYLVPSAADNICRWINAGGDDTDTHKESLGEGEPRYAARTPAPRPPAAAQTSAIRQVGVFFEGGYLVVFFFLTPYFF